MTMLKELAVRLQSLYDNVRQLYGSVLVKLSRRNRNHAILIAGIECVCLCESPP